MARVRRLLGLALAAAALASPARAQPERPPPANLASTTTAPAERTPPANLASAAAAQSDRAKAAAGAAPAEGSAAALLPACRLYVAQAARGDRLRLERGVCIGTVETVLLLHRPLRAAYRFCPPRQVTLLDAMRIVVAFADRDREAERSLHEVAIEAFQDKWPCQD
ncbi:MAG TPA: Rap1a/Tai family immunity protein [Microvirga sp.]|jgi:hypothetical protein|nr:Rap1a/Tai family immunity protein [Microvirga sp.]